jgi:glutathione S-transferase
MRLYSYRASGNCLKVRMLLGALELEYEHVETDIFAGETLTPGFQRLNPLRETPVLELTGGQTITQSNAVLAFLADGTPWAGVDAIERAQALSWCCFEQERLMPGCGSARFWARTGRGTREQIAERREAGRRALDHLDDRLRERRWLVGDAATIADLACYPYARAGEGAGLALEDWPALSRWLGDVVALPGVVDDCVDYPPNARAGRSRSIYDADESIHAEGS